MKAGFWSGVLVLLGLMSLPATAQVAAVETPTGPIVAGPYVAVDAATGETLMQSFAGASWYPASLTKLMTMYIVFQELKAGRLSLGSPVTISQHAHDVEYTLGLAVGSSLTVEQSLMALVAHSPNDVAAALGELVAGSEPQFAQRMTDTAHKLGMNGTQYRNASGLPNPEQVTTARDLAILATALVRDFPQYYGYFHTQEFMLGRQRIGPGVKFVEMYSPYADGLKTGFICASGFNLVGSAVRDGRRMIGVALGFRRAELRDEFMVRMLDQAFAMKTAGGRPKIWQLRDEGGTPATIFPYSECNPWRYDFPGDAAWLGTYGDVPSARRAHELAEAQLATLGITRLGRELVLPMNVNGAERRASFVADLEPGVADKLCAYYQSKKIFCQVKKPQEFSTPFRGFLKAP